MYSRIFCEYKSFSFKMSTEAEESLEFTNYENIFVIQTIDEVDEMRHFILNKCGLNENLFNKLLSKYKYF